MDVPLATPGAAATAETSPTTSVAETQDGADATTPKAPVITGFRPMRMPSEPFWLALIGVGIIAAALLTAGGSLFVFALGGVLSVFLVPIVNRLERRGISRVTASILVIAIVVIIAVTVLIVCFTILIEQGTKLIQNWPIYEAELKAGYETMNIPESMRNAIDAVLATIHDATAAVDPGTVILGFLQGFLGIVGTLFAFLILPFFTFYLVKDQPKMARSFYAGIPDPWKQDVSTTISFFGSDFATYFKAELLVGAIMGVAVTIGMTVIGIICGGGPLVTFALLLGLIAFVMELLPQIGPIISYIPALLLALVTSPLAVALVSIFYFIAFNIEGSVLVPTFEGRMISFSGATVDLPDRDGLRARRDPRRHRGSAPHDGRAGRLPPLLPEGQGSQRRAGRRRRRPGCGAFGRGCDLAPL